MAQSQDMQKFERSRRNVSFQIGEKEEDELSRRNNSQ